MPVFKAILLSDFLFTILDLICVKYPSEPVGIFLNKYDEIIELKIESPKNSNRS